MGCSSYAHPFHFNMGYHASYHTSYHSSCQCKTLYYRKIIRVTMSYLHFQNKENKLFSFMKKDGNSW